MSIFARYRILLLALLGLACPAGADEVSAALVADGAAELEAGHPDLARNLLEAALLIDPEDGQAHALLGAAVLRLGAYQRALEEFDAARGRGARIDDEDLERGRALFGLERFEEAIGHFEAHDEAAGGWEAAQAIGLCHVYSGDLPAARPWLEKALDRESPDEIVLHFHLGRAAQAEDDVSAATLHYEAVVRLDPDSPYAAQLGPEVRELEIRAAELAEEAEEESKPWLVRLTLGGGYNDNAILLGQDQVLPQEIAREESVFFEQTLLSSYVWRFGERASLVASHTFFSSQFLEIEEFDSIGFNPQLSFNYAITDELRAQVGVGFTETLVDMERFSSDAIASVKGVYRPAWLEWTETVVEYSHSRFEFHDTIASVFERDGFANTVRISEQLQVPGTELGVELSFAHTWNRTEGREFDLNGDAVSILAHHPLPWDLQIAAFGSVAWQRYRHGSVRVVDRDHRRDIIYTGAVRLQRSFGDHLRVFLGYRYSHSQSTINLFEYDQNIIQAGVEIEF